jgi:flavorubredoxin
MPITNPQSGTNVEEIASGIYRINTPLPPSVVPGGFSFNQYLIADEQPLLFHLGPKSLFPEVRQAVATILPPESLRFLAFSHFESDECGALNEWLTLAPKAEAVCSRVGAMVNINDFAIRPPKPMAHQMSLELGAHRLSWIDAPHLPHGWDCGFMMDLTTQTLFCGDLFTQPGPGTQALIATDILGPSETFRKKMDYFSHTKNLGPLMDPLIAQGPKTLACMHGSAWQGDGAQLLSELKERLEEPACESNK